ncbi:MAG: hypothetical protein E7247_03025 [Paenibacillaceae bacterium]|nr:hypothetical protein [Paenibacillaceae bacterium]
MKDLHDMNGKHIANFVNGQLHNVRGKNIGHYLEREQIFIDMHGRYLGEIVNGNRLLYYKASPYMNTNFGVYGNYSNIGNYGNYGNIGHTSFAGYVNVEIND